jgi:urease subunit alpha
VLKGGFIASVLMGDANASIATPKPVHHLQMLGSFGRVLQATSLTFMSDSAIAADMGNPLGLRTRLSLVKACRSLKKSDMVHNAYLPKMKIDAQTYRVRADGQLLTCDPATVLPQAQKYFLF